jgi:5,10-methylenetetrahydromethanopterin reductase
MLADAGQYADGVLTLAGSDMARVAANRAAVVASAQLAGRRPEDVGFVVGAFCHVTSDIERDARMLKPIVLHHAGLGRAAMLDAGIDIDVPPRSVMPDAYPDMVHAEDWDAAVAEASRYVSDEMAVRFARAFCLFGSAAEIAQQIRELSTLGVTGLYLRHVGNYTLPDELIDALAQEVMPLCRADPAGRSASRQAVEGRAADG